MVELKTLLEEKSARLSDKTYIYFRDQRWGYRQMNELSNRFAHCFQSLGLRKGDHVAVMLPNSPEWIACWFGLAKLGAVLVAFNTQWKAEGISYALRQTDAKCCVVAPEYLPELQKAAKPPELFLIIADFGPDRPLLEGAHSLSFLLPRASVQNPSWDPPEGRDSLIITFTSGTTGWPKAVLNPHQAYIAAAEDLRDYVELNPGDIIYTCLPLYHANPQAYCVLTALAMEGAMALAERFSASRFWQEIRHYRATAFSYVGAVLPILLKQPVKEEEKSSSAKKCFGGGAPREIHEAMTERFGLKVCELYGMSETGTWNTINRPGEIHPGSVGKVRESFELKIFDDYDNELPPGEIGEIVIRPQKPFIMFLGYYKMAEETIHDFRNLWFHTGDLGRMDDEGYFYFCGRKKESIRRGGENISPYEIEKVLTDHPAISEAAAVGVPDPILGEEIKVYLVHRKGKSVNENILIERCKEKLPKFMIPRYLEFVPELPKTASEKIQKLFLKGKGIGSAWDRENPQK